MGSPRPAPTTSTCIGGDDRAALLEEVTNWPTYYPADMTPAQIVDEMLAH